MNKISSLFKSLFQVIRKVDKYNTTLESCKGREVNCVITWQVIPCINNSFRTKWRSYVASAVSLRKLIRMAPCNTIRFWLKKITVVIMNIYKSEY